jgi:hypothetical protein
MVCAFNERAEGNRREGDGLAGLSLTRELSDEAKGRLVVLPGALPFAVGEEPISRRLLTDHEGREEDLRRVLDRIRHRSD